MTRLSSLWRRKRSPRPSYRRPDFEASAAVYARQVYARHLTHEALEWRLVLTALDDYVNTPDANYGFSLFSTEVGANYTLFTLDMTSQQWRSASEVNRTLWKHWVYIVVPDDTVLRDQNTGLLLVSGRDNSAAPLPSNSADVSNAITTAVGSGLITVLLSNIPNQPLTFADNATPMREDNLIAYSMDKYLDTGDPTWLALFPMVKASVRAMDTAESFLASRPSPKFLQDFIVSGASKRGWTTWLTAAVDAAQPDPRIIGIAPAVYEGLNLDEQFVHQVDLYGELGPALDPYVNFGIDTRLNTPQGQEMLELIDPYEYRTRLTMPKISLNATGDEFFAPDSAQFYFNDLPGEKYLRYAINVGHDLNLDPTFVASAVAPLITAVLTGQPRPQFSWQVMPDDSIRVVATTSPLEVRLYQASDPDGNDYRQDQTTPPVWSFTTLTGTGNVFVGSVPVPASGSTAFFVDLIFPPPLGAIAPYQLSTELHIVKAPTFPPVTTDDSVSMFEETQIDIDVLANDDPGDQPIDPATLQIVTPPGVGIATINPDRTIRYVPPVDFSGVVTFFYRVQDIDGKVSRLTSVEVTVIDINDPPVAQPDVALTLEDTPVAINVLANDDDIDDVLTGAAIRFDTLASNGTLAINAAGRVVYTPNPNYFGPDSFTYHLVDPRGLPSNVVAVSITVISVNDVPFAVDDMLVAPVNGDVSFNILANDSDPDDVLTTASVIIVRGPAGGSIQNVLGELRYVANPGFFGGDLVTYRLRDGAGALSNLATVRIRVGDPVSFTGRVYIDSNATGAFDAGDVPIPGVQVRIQGSSGPFTIDESRFTDASGLFALDESALPGLLLPGGLYQVSQVHPGAFVNGSTEVATLVKNGQVAGTLQGGLDLYGPAVLVDGVNAVNLNFNEKGLSGQFIAAVPAGHFFLASAGANGAILAAGGTTQALNLLEGDVWYSLDGGWSGVLTVVLSSDPAQGSAQVGLYDKSLRQVAASSTPGSASFTYTGTPGVTYFVKVSGTNTDADLHLAATPQILPGPQAGASIGVYNPQTATFYLRDTNSPGWPDIAPFQYGQPGWIAVSGDWDGDGGDSIGLFNTATATFYLRNVNSSGVADVPAVHYGMPGWAPVVGDWDGDGIDTIGVFDPGTATFYLRNTNDSGVADLAFAYGAPGWTPIAGDWNNDQVDSIGVYNPHAATFYLRNSNGAGAVDTPVFAFGAPGWLPVVGDFNGDLYDTIGVFNPQTAQFYLRNANTWGGADVPVFAYGGAGFRPIVGHWRSVIAAGESLDTTSHTGQWAPTLAANKVAPLVQEAVGRWLAAGIDPRGAAQLAHAKVQIVDLPGTQVGRTVGNLVYLDINAAGNGWFVDTTPSADEEFALLASGQLTARAGTTAAGRVDLLTVLMHELGHVLGALEAGPHGNDVMTDLLAPGVRRSPDPGAVDALMAGR